MLGTNLQGAWPSCLNCLGWSHDSELAVALGEHVDILVPNVKPPHLQKDKLSQQSGAKLWDNVRLKVNVFTSAEVPVQEPARSAISSIGEEQSVFTVSSLSWSSAGLAKHGRCALVVLTTNHVLSIWESTKNPREVASWKRVLVINHALERYFEKAADGEEETDELEVEERLRLRMRIRGFTWAPENTSSVPVQTGALGSRTSLKQDQFLAVANETHDILIVRISSPYDILSTERSSWSAEVIYQFPCMSMSSLAQEARQSLPSSLLNDYLTASSTVTYIAWSDWHGTKSYVAYLVGSGLKIKPVHSDPQSGHTPIYASDHEICIPGEHDGPLTWVNDQVRENICLLSFSGNELICTTFDQSTSNTETETGIMDTARRNLGQRWDEVSGVALTNDASTGGVHMHYALHLHHHDTPSISIPLSSSSTPGVSSWQQQIQHHQTAFSAENDLGGNVLTRVWGVAASPFGDFVVACITLHPNDMMEYIGPVDQQTILVVGMEGARKVDFGGVRRGASLESVLFDIYGSCGRDLAVMANTYQPSEHAVDHLYTTHYQAISVDEQESFGFEPETSDAPQLSLDGCDRVSAHAVIRRFRQRVLFDEALVKRRFSRLLFPDHQLPGLVKDLDTEILKSLCNQVECLLLYSTTTMDRRIIRNYNCSMQQIGHVLPNQQMDNGTEATSLNLEQCEICGRDIEFENLRWARCSTGHHFVRCALTFLAIQAPGISKFCSICGKQYLSNEYIEEHEEGVNGMENGERPNAVAHEIQTDVTMAEADHHEQSSLKQGISLARILFSACDVCIHCGGKFVG